jgi:hypothetical protein
MTKRFDVNAKKHYFLLSLGYQSGVLPHAICMLTAVSSGL